MSSKTKYVLWDWNGTLMDDVAAAFNTTNTMLARRGRGMVSLDQYRRAFSFPVRRFYEAVGFQLEDEDWDAMAEEYHQLLRSDPSQHLRAGATQALEMVKSRGIGQSIISALRQDLLREDTAAAGIVQYMECIYGVDNLDGETKLSRAHELVAKLGIDPAEAILIGDTCHDYETAKAIGAKCVLVDVGHQSLAVHAPVDACVAPSLLDAVKIALGVD